MRNKTINELTSLENPRLTDTLPIWDGTEGKTKKVSLAKIPANVITPVNSLPESPNILDRVYRYNNKYYVGNESAQTLTELAPKADIPTVVDTVADGNMNPVTSNAVYDKLNILGKLYSIHIDDVPATGSSGWNYGVWAGTANLPKGTYLVHVITPNAGSGSVAGTGFSCIVNAQFPTGYPSIVRSGLLGWNTGDVYSIDITGFLTVPTSGSFNFNFNVYTNGGSFSTGNVYLDFVRITTN